jgi:L,D-transpeptidase catalytic domain
MPRIAASAHAAPASALLLCATLAALGCKGDRAEAAGARTAPRAAAAARPGAQTPAAERDSTRMDAEFPLHGLVTGAQLKVRSKPEPEALTVGWLRVGSRVRLAPEPVKTPTCRSGFHRVYPIGYACAGEGIQVGPTPPQSGLAVNPPAKHDPLPYRYFFVKEPKVPEYHRLPSRDEQRAARDFVAHYLELQKKSAERAEKLIRGEVAGEMTSPTVVRRYLERGFFVAGAGVEERASRQFVRTVRGTYIKMSQLQERKGGSFQGVELGKEHALPLAWAVREATAFSIKPREDGSLRFVTDERSPTYARLSLVPWAGRERAGTELLHTLKDGRHLKHWFAAVAEKIARPEGVRANEPWVHINIEQQTLVLYQGDEPVYATLVSTGLPDHDTPIGLFEIRAKYIADSMSDIGPEAGDERYSIEDVPWTQYFSGSIAMHGAFWHERFGLRRSHGCVNLSPYDAHRVFDHTWPVVEDGWHGTSTDQTGLPASKVYVSER